MIAVPPDGNVASGVHSCAAVGPDREAATPFRKVAETAAALLIMLAAAYLRLAALSWAQWRNDEEIIWLQAVGALAAGRFPLAGIPSDLGVANGPAEMLPVLVGALLQAPYVAYVLVALLNVIAVAGIYSLGRVWYGAPVGIAAAALCAVAPWAVIHSRRLWGNDMIAPFAVLFVAALWQLAMGRRWALPRAALWLALLLQMYIAALVNLLVLAVGLLFGLRARARGELTGLPGPALLAFGIFAVLTGGYFVTALAPNVLDLTRAVRDSRGVAPAMVALPNWSGLAMLVRSVGSDGYKYYLDHSPPLGVAIEGPLAVATALAQGLFWAGVVLLVWRLGNLFGSRRAEQRAQAVAAALLLTWVMAEPAALTAHSGIVCACFLLPSYPAQYLVEAIGAFGVGQAMWTLVSSIVRHGVEAYAGSAGVPPAPVRKWRVMVQGDVRSSPGDHRGGRDARAPSDRRPPVWPLSSKASQQAPRVAKLASIVLVAIVLIPQAALAAPFFQSIRSYYPADLYGLPYAWHQRIVDAVATAWQPGMPVVVSGHGELDGVLRDEIDTRLPASSARIIDDQTALVLPGRGESTELVLLGPGAKTPGHSALEQLIASDPAILRATVTVPGQGTTFRVLRVDAADAGHLGDLLATHDVTASHDIEVRFAGDAFLNQMILPVRLLPKETTPLALQWTTLRTRPYVPAESYYVHLVDRHGTTAALDAAFLPPGSWRAGERVWTFGNLSDPGAAGTAMRQAEIGMYVLNGKGAAAGVTPLPMSDAQENGLARLRIGPFVVRARSSGPAVRAPIQHDVVPGLSLVSVTTPAPGEPGGALAVHLRWSTETGHLARYTVFVHLLDTDGKLQAQSDAEPDSGQFPTSSWLAGELVDDVHTLRLPSALAPGSYTLLIGLYPTGQPGEAHVASLRLAVEVAGSGR